MTTDLTPASEPAKGSGTGSTQQTSFTSRLLRRFGTLQAEVQNAAYAMGLLRSTDLRLPDFLGIGYMKCGTTWLYENLRAHPDVFMSESKELRFFVGGNVRAGLRSYSRNFEAADGRVCGEISPPYAWLQTERIRFIQRVMPDVRLLVLLRDPIAREWSRVRHEAEHEGLDLRTADDEAILYLIDHGNAMEKGGYSASLDQWRAVFPDNQFFIGLYEDIGRRPEHLMTRVLEHLDVNTDVDWTEFPLREVIVPPVGDRYADMDQGRGVVADDHQHSGAYFPDRFRDRITAQFEGELRELHRRFGDEILVWDSAARVLGR